MGKVIILFIDYRSLTKSWNTCQSIMDLTIGSMPLRSTAVRNLAKMMTMTTGSLGSSRYRFQFYISVLHAIFQQSRIIVTLLGRTEVFSFFEPGNVYFLHTLTYLL